MLHKIMDSFLSLGRHTVLNVVLTCAIARAYLTIIGSSFDYLYPVKQKQALLGSNLSGIAGTKMSWTKRSVAMSYAPAHHFGICLRKPKKLSTILGHHNVEDAFSLKDSQAVVGKKILLIDDIYGSGATIKEIGKFLTEQGADLIVPIVLAKTVGSDKL